MEPFTSSFGNTKTCQLSTRLVTVQPCYINSSNSLFFLSTWDFHKHIHTQQMLLDVE